MAARSVVHVFVAVLVLAACWGDPGLHRENVAFAVGEEGQVVVLSCAGIEPETVNSWRMAGNNSVIGDDDDVLLEALSRSDYQSGPLGLVEAEMLTPFEGAQLDADPGGAVRLEADKAQPGTVVLTDGRVMPLEEFAALVGRQDECRLKPDG